MLLEGTVLNGAIVLDGNAKLPEGARVEINLKQVPEHIADAPRNGDHSVAEFDTLLDELAEGLSPLSALPADFTRSDIYSDHD